MVQDIAESIARLLAVMRRHGLTEVEVASLSGISITSIRRFKAGALPEQARTRTLVREFLDRNEGARRRSDLKLPAAGIAA